MTATISDEELARSFHDCYERLAPEFGWHTAEATRTFDSRSANGSLMIATVREVVGPLRDRLAAAEKALHDIFNVAPCWMMTNAEADANDRCHDIARQYFLATLAPNASGDAEG